MGHRSSLSACSLLYCKVAKHASNQKEQYWQAAAMKELQKPANKQPSKRESFHSCKQQTAMIQKDGTGRQSQEDHNKPKGKPALKQDWIQVRSHFPCKGKERERERVNDTQRKRLFLLARAGTIKDFS